MDDSHDGNGNGNRNDDGVDNGDQYIRSI